MRTPRPLVKPGCEYTLRCNSKVNWQEAVILIAEVLMAECGRGIAQDFHFPMNRSGVTESYLVSYIWVPIDKSKKEKGGSHP